MGSQRRTSARAGREQNFPMDARKDVKLSKSEPEGDCGKWCDLYIMLWKCLGCLYAVEGRGECVFYLFFFFCLFFSKNNKDS